MLRVGGKLGTVRKQHRQYGSTESGETGKREPYGRSRGAGVKSLRS
jgi:hypothetical protein